MRSRLAVALALVAALVAIAPAAGAARRATTKHVFAAFEAGALARGLHVVKEVRGSCWTGSEATDRSDSWRCMSGNFIYDPCFSSATPGTTSHVICASSPFVRGVVELVLTKRLPYAYGNAHHRATASAPWAVRLTNGVACVALQGATGAIAGMRIGYACSNKGVLVGNPRRSTPTWRIFFAKSFAASNVRLVPVAEAWW
ncbi:MAG TPA: hypothetical protein VFA05_01805 [Gaiellaceae bacterium]|nr:hypothetical protein [Gaiellaceae bacterium]